MLCCASENAHAQLADYIYPYFDQPSYSNYGTVGLIQMPTARLQPAGSLAFSFSNIDYLISFSIGIGIKPKLWKPLKNGSVAN